MELLKQTVEYRCDTEIIAKQLIEDTKAKEIDGGYELTSYTSTHKIKKDDDFYIVKMIKVFN